jgi:hypothetical protein
LNDDWHLEEQYNREGDEEQNGRKLWNIPLAMEAEEKYPEEEGLTNPEAAPDDRSPRGAEPG